MNRTMKYSLLIVMIALVAVTGCKKDKKKSVPALTTAAVTAITPTSATGGGTITDNGGADVTEAGVVYSKTNQTPTTADTKLAATATSGSFTVDLAGLSSGTNYYIRAYATNSVGTGYGNAVTFMTGNAAPVATAVTITGTAEVNQTLTGSYTYSDAEGNAEAGSTFQWYRANDGTGAGETAIAGATALTYLIQDADQGKYIRFGVTPKAAAGTTAGAEVKSAFVGGVGEATTVTFMYNNVSVTYGILTSAATGKKWLDRNLGAPNAANAHNDFANYGDLFQWGRLADGHQLITRNGPTDADMVPVNGATSATDPYQTSTTDNPGHSLFIISTGDWRNPRNDNLWQGVSGINNPCPSGWRLATATEWAAENLSNLTDAYTKLKITLSGLRSGDGAEIFQSASSGRYWTSTIADPGVGELIQATRVSITASGTNQLAAARGNGYPVRCIKN